MRLNLMTMVYGKDYVQLFKDYCLKSLFYPDNIPRAILDGYRVKWDIYTTQDSEQLIKDAVQEHHLFEVEYDIKIIDKIIITSSGNDTNYQCLYLSLQKAIEENALFYLATPDVMIGNGSLSNLLAYKTDKPLCLAAAHVRVAQESFKIEDRVYSNAELVTLSMLNLSQSWRDTFVEADANCSYCANVTTRKITDNLWAVTHRIPTIYLARAIPSDIEFFEKKKIYGEWDWGWGEVLTQQNRYRVIGSSDMFFGAEITPKDRNNAHVMKGCQWNDDGSNRRQHSFINRNFITTLRGY